MRVPLRLVISVQQRVLSEGSAGLTRQQTRTAWCRASDISVQSPPGARSANLYGQIARPNSLSVLSCTPRLFSKI
jgi:hypothetical protein